MMAVSSKQTKVRAGHKVFRMRSDVSGAVTQLWSASAPLAEDSVLDLDLDSHERVFPVDGFGYPVWLVVSICFSITPL